VPAGERHRGHLSESPVGSLVDVGTLGTDGPRRARVQVAATRRSSAVAVATLLTAGALALLGAGPVSAHASLVRADPADGSTVATAPSRVTLTFDENVRAPAVIVVTDSDGRRVSTGTAQALDNTAATAVTISQGGTYTIAFRVVSADGHPAAGRTAFRVTAGATSSPVSSAQPSTGAQAGATADGAQPRRRTWFISSIAGAALLGGLALLTHGRRGSPRAGRARDSA
jgi:methionine-rich copper-binding protein CopC